MSSSKSDLSSDENSVKTAPVNSKSTSNFKNEVELDAGLLSLKRCPMVLTAEELASLDYECWMVTLPGTLDAEKLRNLELSMSKSTKFKIEKAKYEAIVNQKNDEYTFLLPDKNGTMKLTGRQMIGTISVVKNLNLKTKNNQITDFQTKKIIDLPQGLKRRHPIYGKDLDTIMCQSAGLKKCKNEIMDSSPHTVKERKKRKRTN